MTSSEGGPLEFHNIQEIVDIELMFELICMLFFVFVCILSSFQIIRKEETNNKTGENTKLLLYYIVVKLMITVAYFLISSSVILRK